MSELPQADRFAASRTDDPFWNESAWFSFSIPERGLHGLIYYFFRPNMRLIMGGPIMWDASGAHNYDCLYFDWHHIQPMPAAAEKFNFTAPNSLTVKLLEPLTAYRIGYDANGFKLDLEWRAIAEPHHFLGMEIEATGASAENRLHLEQCGRMTGAIEHRGELYPIDCYSLRDTSFGVRKLDGTSRGSYFWAILSPETAFHTMTMGDGDEQKAVGGFITLEGKTATLVRGSRRVVRDGRYTPAEFVFEGEDELGRTLKVTGRPKSDFLFNGFPRVQVTWSLLEVDFDGETGWGDIQEFVPSEVFRQRIRGR
jgi:hypothetical protein